MALLSIYMLILGLLALMGFMALALPKPPASSNAAMPALINATMPSWFAGFAFGLPLVFRRKDHMCQITSKFMLTKTSYLDNGTAYKKPRYQPSALSDEREGAR